MIFVGFLKLCSVIALLGIPASFLAHVYQERKNHYGTDYSVGLGVVSIVAGIVVILGVGVGWLARNECEHKYNDLPNKWSWSGTCQVQIDGNWIPDDNYRVIP